MPVSDRYRRYNNSQKGQARSARYEAAHLDRQPNSYFTERYHRLQEEMGSHSNPAVILAGLRIIKALETAEVVDLE